MMRIGLIGGLDAMKTVDEPNACVTLGTSLHDLVKI